MPFIFLPLKDVGTTPVLLHVKLSRCFPRLILEAQEDDLSAHGVLNTLERGRLVLRAGAGGAVAVTGVGPPGLQDVNRLVTADAVHEVDLGLDEGPGLVGGDVGVEEGVQVGTADVDGPEEG